MRSGGQTGLYVHVPLCRTKCRYCALPSRPTTRSPAPERLTAALRAEIESLRGRWQFTTAYVGGGSPTALPPDCLLALVRDIGTAWPNLDEFTVECHPAQVTEALLAGLRRHGVDRLSFGVQSLQDDELKQMGRTYRAHDVPRVLRWARQAGFENLGIDLIFGWPGSSLARWTDTLAGALELGVPHISAYGLSIEAPSRLARQVRQGRLEPLDEETQRRMLELTVRRLTSAGYEHYEISNFARPGFACRHNLGTWLNAPYVGVGPAAASSRPGRRGHHTADVEAYCRAALAGRPIPGRTYRLTPEEHACETAVLGLRLRRGIDRRRYRQQTGQDLCTLFESEIQNHRRTGLLAVSEATVVLTEDGLPVADRVLCDFASL